VDVADLRANHASSSSLRDRAGNGAPGPSPSCVGRRTLPSLLKGLYFCIEPKREVCADVLTGSSRRDHPRLFMLSLNDEDAMVVQGSFL
jgi:hypothetical protein